MQAVSHLHLHRLTGGRQMVAVTVIDGLMHCRVAFRFVVVLLGQTWSLAFTSGDGDVAAPSPSQLGTVRQGGSSSEPREAWQRAVPTMSTRWRTTPHPGGTGPTSVSERGLADSWKSKRRASLTFLAFIFSAFHEYI